MSPIAPGGCGVPHTGRQIGVGIGCTGMGQDEAAAGSEVVAGRSDQAWGKLLKA